MASDEGKVSADDTAGSTAVDESDAALATHRLMNREGIDRREAQVSCEDERLALRQQKAVASLQKNGVLDTFDRKPALTGDDGIAFDSIVLSKTCGPWPTYVEATGDVGAGFQQ